MNRTKTLQNYKFFRTFAEKLKANMSKIIKIVRKRPFTSLCLAAITGASMVPVPETPLSNVALMDKWVHFIMYATLSLAVTLDTWRELAAGKKKIQPWSWILPVVWGCLMELAQAYLTTCRSGDWLDALANTIGATIGCCAGIPLVWWLTRRYRGNS